MASSGGGGGHVPLRPPKAPTESINLPGIALSACGVSAEQ